MIKNLTKVLYTKYKEDNNGKRIKDKNGKDIIIEEKTSRNIFELETKLFPCLVDMKFKGVKIDVEKAKAFGKRLEKTKNNIINYIARKTNIRIEIWAASSIKALLDHQILMIIQKHLNLECHSFLKIIYLLIKINI